MNNLRKGVEEVLIGEDGEMKIYELRDKGKLIIKFGRVKLNRKPPCVLKGGCSILSYRRITSDPLINYSIFNRGFF